MPYAFIGCLAMIASTLLGTFFHATVVCPQDARGLSRLVLSVAVGVPVGGGLTTLFLIGLDVSLPVGRTAGGVAAIRRVTEMAALGAIYGVILTTSATISALGNERSCDFDLLQNIGNGATWGTLAGFSFGIPTMIKSMKSDSKSIPIRFVKFFQAYGMVCSIVVGVGLTMTLVHLLLTGHGWPT